MHQNKPPSPKEQAEQRSQEEALRVAKSIQAPGQTREQTKLVAKGIEKGIALYKQQQKAKARELDKARKKALRAKVAEADPIEEPLDEADWLAPSPARPALYVAGTIFTFAALLHGLRYALGWRVVVESIEISPVWSLAGMAIAGALAIWMFHAGRD
jgi:hypothetical protein